MQAKIEEEGERGRCTSNVLTVLAARLVLPRLGAVQDQ